MNLLILFKNLILIKYLNVIKLDNIQTILHTIISKGQCTHKITLDNNIMIIKGVNIIHIFLNQAKNKLVRNATDAVAWSEGNDASGIWWRSNCHTHFNASSGLSICIICWMNKLIDIQRTTE